MNNRKKLLGAFALLALISAAVVLGLGFVPPDKAPPSVPFNKYAPEQPIPYSHKLHAGDLQIPCEYCHTYARRSRSAGIPALEQCMACHKLLATDRPNIQKVRDAFEAKQPIEWVKVHDLPDFVYFSHKRHISAGFACQECHGPIETMEKVWREAPLTMGWCVNCHKSNLDKGASVDCLTCHK
ncbi:MAG: cytochrome c3 family protein [Acidobacteria bacterium]|nr:cytochrome c3 family protein [Acidobacteriota bacterium]MCB9397899.1 cytochrome c3 family protein [Acidobacteriota bacterium]